MSGKFLETAAWLSHKRGMSLPVAVTRCKFKSKILCGVLLLGQTMLNMQSLTRENYIHWWMTCIVDICFKTDDFDLEADILDDAKNHGLLDGFTHQKAQTRNITEKKKRKLRIFIRKVHSFQVLLCPILRLFFFWISARMWFTGLKENLVTV